MFTIEAVVFPEPFLDGKEVILAIHAGLDEAAQLVKIELERPAETWMRKVQMEIESSSFTRDIGTDDLIYGWIARGTPKHDIPLSPKIGGSLRYLKGGTPKTQPGVLTSTSGSKGTGVRYAKQVTHPGIAARNWDELISQNWDADDTLSKIVQARIDKIVE